jgi:hypothetical protein
MHRHAEVEDTGAAVAELTWAVLAELTSELAWLASVALASEELSDVIRRAFPELPLAMRRELATGR